MIDKVSLDSDRVIKMHSIEFELVEGASQEMEDRDRIRVLWPVLFEGASQEMEGRDWIRVLWPVFVERASQEMEDRVWVRVLWPVRIKLTVTRT